MVTGLGPEMVSVLSSTIWALQLKVITPPPWLCASATAVSRLRTGPLVSARVPAEPVHTFTVYVVGPHSNAPISQEDSPSSGRDRPRWSEPPLAEQPCAPVGMTSIAALPASSAMVWVEPPLS